MTGAREGIDPRYDPRFQRGYDGHGADASNASRTAAVEPGGVAAVEPPVRQDPGPISVAQSARAADVRTEHPVGPPSGADRGQDRGPDAEIADASAEEADDDVDLDVDLDHDHDPDLGIDFEAAPGPAPADIGWRAGTWFIAGWLVTGVLALVGLWILWTANSDIRTYYGGPTTAGESDFAETFRALAWSLAPSLLLASSAGAVVVTAFAAGLPTNGADRAERAFARRPAWWALVVIASICVIAVPILLGAISEGLMASSSLMFDGSEPDERTLAQFETMARGQVAQALLAPIGVMFVASIVGLVVLEARRALRRTEVGGPTMN